MESRQNYEVDVDGNMLPNKKSLVIIPVLYSNPTKLLMRRNCSQVVNEEELMNNYKNQQAKLQQTSELTCKLGEICTGGKRLPNNPDTGQEIIRE